MKIRHIVIINFKKNINQDYSKLLKSTEPLILQISGVDSYRIYKNESHYVPENIVSFGVEIVFKDRESLKFFMDSPLHYEANAIFESYLAEPAYMVLTHELGMAI